MTFFAVLLMVYTFRSLLGLHGSAIMLLMRVRLELCKINVSPPVILYYFLLWFYLFCVLESIFLCCLNLMFVFIDLVKFG